MKNRYVHSFAGCFVGIVLIIPAAYFIMISILKYLPGGHFISDTRWQRLEKIGVTESIDFNVKLLILFVSAPTFFIGYKIGAALAL
jgi:hypothetical protein